MTRYVNLSVLDYSHLKTIKTKAAMGVLALICLHNVSIVPTNCVTKGLAGHRVHICNKLFLFFKGGAPAPQSNSVISHSCQHVVFYIAIFCFKVRYIGATETSLF